MVLIVVIDIMANVVSKLDSEVRWGAILATLQTDNDKLCAGLRTVLGEISTDMSTLEYQLQSNGIAPLTDGRYNRLFQLKSLLGGIYYALRGVDGMLSGVIVELLRDLEESETK